MRIGNVELKNDFIFAPIAGYSDVGFRALCSFYGAALTVTEMVSAKGLNFKNPNTETLLASTENEKPIAVQLFGSEPEQIFKAAKDPILQKFDIIDINMGCPVRKITSNGEGSALMQNPKLITELVQAAVEGGKRPVTVKLRAGYFTGKPAAVECALAAQYGGASAVTVHPRYREQFYSGKADWSIIAEVKRAVNIPVVANGDIVDSKSAQEVKEQTNCDGFMIGRAALGKPWIFAELTGREFSLDVKADILKQIEISKRYFSENTIANVMKAHLCYYSKNTAHAKAVRTAMSDIKDLGGLIAAVEKYF